jgi:hypothetical protein
MATKKTKRNRTRLIECFCNSGWVCEDHPGQPWNHEGCGGAGDLARILSARKIQILFSNPSIVRFSPARESRQLEKVATSIDYGKKQKGC